MIKKIVLLGLVVLSFQVTAPAHAKKGECHRELAKGAAELAGNLQAGVFLGGKSTSAQVASSRRDIERKSKENYPCAEEDFMGWYDSAYARAEAQWNLATKDQKVMAVPGERLDLAGVPVHECDPAKVDYYIGWLSAGA